MLLCFVPLYPRHAAHSWFLRSFSHQSGRWSERAGKYPKHASFYSKLFALFVWMPAGSLTLLRLQYPKGIFWKNPLLMSKQLGEILLCFLSTSSFLLSPPCQADASGRIISIFSCWLRGLFFFCAPDALLVQLLVVVWLSSLTWRWRAAKWRHCEFSLVPLCSAWVMLLTANAPRMKDAGIGQAAFSWRVELFKNWIFNCFYCYYQVYQWGLNWSDRIAC